MKILRVMTCVLFFSIIMVPVLLFNFEEGVISEIDNRELAQNPFLKEKDGEEDLTQNIENYISDRIGLRDEMILAYTVLNDRIWGEMVHPSYIYGEDGYIFGAGLTVYPCYDDYHEVFANMVEQVQKYCTERDVPFLFVFNPAKPAVLTSHLPKGMNYDRSWVDLFLEALDDRGVRYIDNTELLQEKVKEGQVVFNQKYDANHWNDLGALYGSNNILETLKKDIKEIHICDMEEDVVMSENLQTTLLASKFPIHEMVPQVSLNMDVMDITEKYREELVINPSFPSFQYYINSKRKKEGAPRALVFQGSYMNGLGTKYLQNGFGEYISVHDYQNIINFPYYFNIFKPECVVFEVAEYTFTDAYFNFERMNAIRFNPELRNAMDLGDEYFQNLELGQNEIAIEKEKVLTKVVWTEVNNRVAFGWLRLGGSIVSDFMWGESGYETTILTEEYERYVNEMEIITAEEDGFCTVYSL